MIDFIQKNIQYLTLEHLKLFAKANQISYSEEEIQIIYIFIQKHYQDLLRGNQTCFKKIKSKISPTLYQKLLTLYQEYKEKYI
ncbi:MAG: hypothetical protein IKF71_03990 [Bacilli bacterium]|nr:hypothetical protein [Bacilli bacterium]